MGPATDCLNWIGQIIQALGRWIPVIVLIPATQAGVRFGLRGGTHIMKPGLHFYWPITHTVQIVSTTRRTLLTAPQIHRMETMSAIVTYCVSDPAKVVTNYFDYNIFLSQRTNAALSKAYSSELTNVQLSKKIEDILVAEFALTGLSIDQVSMAERSWCLPIKQVTGWERHEDSMR